MTDFNQLVSFCHFWPIFIIHAGEKREKWHLKKIAKITEQYYYLGEDAQVEAVRRLNERLDQSQAKN